MALGLLFCGGASVSVTGYLVKVEGIMQREGYVSILEENLKQSAANLDLGDRSVFQHDNNPKNISAGKQLPSEV